MTAKRRFQFMRGGSQENCLLPVHFLQLQISSQQIPISDLALLQQLLNGSLRGGFGRRDIFFFRRNLQLHHQPIRLRHPLH